MKNFRKWLPWLGLVAAAWVVNKLLDKAAANIGKRDNQIDNALSQFSHN